jgi:inosine-uridine nucleoside N-ribohydrolase
VLLIHNYVDANKSTTGFAIGGRPKGSTTANILDQKKRNELATQPAVQLLAEMQSKKKQSASHIEKGPLTEIILQVKQEYQLPEILQYLKHNGASTAEKK